MKYMLVFGVGATRKPYNGSSIEERFEYIFKMQSLSEVKKFIKEKKPSYQTVTFTNINIITEEEASILVPTSVKITKEFYKIK